MRGIPEIMVGRIPMFTWSFGSYLHGSCFETFMLLVRLCLRLHVFRTLEGKSAAP